MFLTLIFIILILYFIHIILYGGEKSKLFNKIPGPKLCPILGNALDVIKPPARLFYTIRRFACIYDGIYRMQFPNLNLLYLYNPEDIETILTSQKLIVKEDFYEFLHPWLGTGLLTSAGEKWQNRRKILTPAFHFNILKQFCKVFMENSEKLIEKLKKIEGEAVEVLPFITDLTLNSICETAMGTTLDLRQKKAIEYRNAIFTLGELLLYRLLRLWIYPEFIFNRTRAGIKQNALLKTLHNFTMNVIDERRMNRAISGDKFEVEDYTEEMASGQKKRLAMLDLLLSAESDGRIDATGIREEVDTFMFEGHDTTTNVIMYTLMMLANNPEAQQLAYEEVLLILGSNTKAIGIETLSDLRYVDRCIKETMRLYPSVPMFGRKITEDIKLRDYFVPANTSCEIHVYDLHRDPKLYPNPGKFDPDRFLPENCAKRHNFAYLPFSAGPRNCIGQRFAMLEIKTAISTILQNFKLEAVTEPNDLIFNTDIVLRTKTPIKVKFLSRH